MEVLDPKISAMVRAAMAAPDRDWPFRRNPLESLLSAETLSNITGFVFQAREHLTPDRLDVETVYLAACYHFARVEHVAPDLRQFDERATMALFSVLHAVRPDIVPQPLRTGFARKPPAVMPPAEILHAVALTLFNDAVRRQDEDRLWRAAGMLADALEAGPSPGSEPVMKFNLGSAYLQLHELTGRPDLLKGGVATIRAAVASYPADRPVPAGMLAILAEAQAKLPPAEGSGEALRERYDRYLNTGSRDPAELDALVVDLRVMFDQTPPHSRERIARQANLAILLRVRFELIGELDDINQSVNLLTDIASTADDDLMHTVNGALAESALHRFIATSDPADLALATRAARASLAGANPNAAHHPQLLITLSAVLDARFRQSGDLGELAEAIRHLEFAYAITPPGNNHQVMRIKLAVALAARDAPDDVVRAATLLRSVENESTGVNAQLAQLELARITARLAELSGRAEDQALAVTRYRDTALMPTHDVRTRLHAAYFWALRSAELGDIAGAVRAFGLALDELLPKLAGLGLGRASTETRLREIPSLACNAAWAEIRAGRPRKALMRLEQGRGVMLARALQLRSGHPDLIPVELAERFEQARAALVGETETAETRRQLAAEFDATVAEIRRVPGFERFQVPLDWPRLKTAADQGPVVVVNVAELGCDVLLVRDDVAVLPLAGVTREEVARRAAQFLDAASGMSATTDFLERHERDQTMMDTLAWLWDHIAGPVLAALEIEKYTDPPRIWWCPTGDLALLPLHAAHHRASDTYVHDLVVSSYTPTLNTLIAARTAPAANESGFVAVGMTSELPAVDDELAALAESSRISIELRDDAATPEAVLAALRAHDHAHLACHGMRIPDDPSGSGLLLHEGLLTVRDLATQQLRGAEFAFLSACHTAAGGRELVDEVITVASALQMCGYREVIGALWTVEDEIMPTLVREIYQQIPVSGAAHALHEATHRLRAVPHYASPLFWASLAHFGI